MKEHQKICWHFNFHVVRCMGTWKVRERHFGHFCLYLDHNYCSF